MTCIKHIATIILMAAFSIPMLMPAVWQLKQSHVQWEMQEALEKQELQQIKVKTAHIKWVKYKKECLINGEMFDVKQLEILNDETLLTGLFDEKEKEIKKSLEDFAKNQQHSNKLQQLVTLFSLIISNAGKQSIPTPDNSFVNLHYTFTLSIYSSPFLGFTTPPPKFS